MRIPIKYKLHCNIILFLFFTPLFMMLSGCESQYDKGYNKGYSKGQRYGYSQGYDSGKRDGYKQGKKDGYEEGNDDGYIDGTKYFVKDKYVPSLGLVILVLISIGGAYFLFNYLKDPVKRKIERKRDIAEREREIKRIKKSIKVKKEEEERLNKIKAKELTMELFRKAEEMIGDAKNQSNVSKFQNEIEIMIIKEYFDATNKKYQEELDVIEEIEEVPNELGTEKSNLVDLLTKKHSDVVDKKC